MGISGEYFKLGKEKFHTDRGNTSHLGNNSRKRVISSNSSFLFCTKTPKKITPKKANCRSFTLQRDEKIIKTVQINKNSLKNKLLH